MNQTNGIKNTSAPKRRSCLGCLGRGVIGLLIFLASLMLVGGIYQATASANDSKKFSPPGKIYNIGDYRLHLYCTGKGSPTVILEAGAGLPALSWYLVQKEVEGFARVCSYDRAGYGWSDPASGPLSPAQVAADLHKLLETADVSGPYILVGHSAGGLYVRAYASRYPSEVEGLVLVDAVREQQNSHYPQGYVKIINNSNAMMPFCQIIAPFGVMRAFKFLNVLVPGNLLPADVEGAFLSTIYRTPYCTAFTNEGKAVSLFHRQPDLPNSLGDLPLIVLSRGITADEEYAQMGAMQSVISRDVYAKVYEANQEMQKELVSLSTQGRQVIATQSSHFIHYDQPDLVIDAIREILSQVRSQ